MLDADCDAACRVDEQRQVDVWRYDEAFDAGCTVEEAWAFSFSGADVGRFRWLLGCGCDPHLAASILI